MPSDAVKSLELPGVPVIIGVYVFYSANTMRQSLSLSLLFLYQEAAASPSLHFTAEIVILP